MESKENGILKLSAFSIAISLAYACIQLGPISKRAKDINFCVEKTTNYWKSKGSMMPWAKAKQVAFCNGGWDKPKKNRNIF